MKQVIVFVRGGVVQSVAQLKVIKTVDTPKCVVVDYDNAEGVDDEAYEMEMLGVSLEKLESTFGLEYIW